MSNIIHFSPTCSKVKYRFRLGELYMVRWYSNRPIQLCKFIQVTPKGFNLLDVQTNKCILKRHLYDNKWSGQRIPKDCTDFKVNISASLIVMPLPKEKLS